MNALVMAFFGIALNFVSTFVGRILVSLGIGVVTFTGLSTTLGWLKTQAVNSALGLPPEVLGMMGVLKVGNCISIVFSAIVARALLDSVNSDSFKRFVKK